MRSKQAKTSHPDLHRSLAGPHRLLRTLSNNFIAASFSPPFARNFFACSRANRTQSIAHSQPHLMFKTFEKFQFSLCEDFD